MFKLDLGKFKKVASDGKSTTMVHDDGHQIKVAHSGLSPKLREQLAAIPMCDGGKLGHSSQYADGGDVGPTVGSLINFPGSPKTAPKRFADGGETDAKDSPQIDPEKAKQMQAGAMQSGWQPATWAKNIKEGLGLASNAQGGPVRKMYAEGTPDGTVQDPIPDSEPAQDSPDQIASDASSQTKASYRKIAKDNLVSYYKSLGGNGLAGAAEDRANDALKQIDEYKSNPSGFSEYGAKHIYDLMDKATGKQTTVQNSQPEQSQSTPSGPIPVIPPKKSLSMDEEDAEVNGAPQQNNSSATQQPMVPQGQPNDVDPVDPSQNSQEPSQQSNEPAPPPPDDSSPQDGVKPVAKPQLGTADAAYQTKPGTPESSQAQQAYLAQEVAAHQLDLANGAIHPKTYGDIFNSKTNVLSKIGTIFGLIASGMGSGLTHQPNALLAMYDKQIQNDLEAQKQNASNAMDYRKLRQAHELQQFQQAQIKSGIPLTAAEAAVKRTEADTNAFALHQASLYQNSFADLAQKVASMPEGPQKEAQKKALAIVYSHSQAKINDAISSAVGASAMAGMMSATGGDQGAPDTTMMKSGIAGPEVAEAGKDFEQKTIPGIPGLAARPVEESDRKQLVAMNTLDQKGKDLLNFIQQHKSLGDISRWEPSIRAQAMQKADELKNFYNGSINGGALTEGRLQWYDSQLKKDPLSIVGQALGSTDRLKEVVNSNALRKNLLLKSYGYKIPGNQNASQSTQSSPNRPLQDKNGRAIVYDKNGNAFYPKK